MSSATTSSVDSAITPSLTKDLVALISLAIVRETHPDWTTESVATRAAALSVQPERVSRLKTAVMPRLEEWVEKATRRGPRPFRWWSTLT